MGIQHSTGKARCLSSGHKNFSSACQSQLQGCPLDLTAVTAFDGQAWQCAVVPVHGSRWRGGRAALSISHAGDALFETHVNLEHLAMKISQSQLSILWSATAHDAA